MGQNDANQLGVGKSINKSLVPLEIMKNIKTISSKSNHNLILMEDGKVYDWVSNIKKEFLNLIPSVTTPTFLFDSKHTKPEIILNKINISLIVGQK